MKFFKRENVVIRESDESRVKELLVQGFKEIGQDGKLIEDEKEKTVPLANLEKLKEEIEKLKKENEELKKKEKNPKEPPKEGEKTKE